MSRKSNLITSIFARFTNGKKTKIHSEAYTITAFIGRLLKDRVNKVYKYPSKHYFLELRDMGEYFIATNLYESVVVSISKDAGAVTVFISNEKHNFEDLETFIQAIRELPFPLNYKVTKAQYYRDVKSAVIELFRI